MLPIARTMIGLSGVTAGTALGRGINSTSKVFSEVSGGLQSLNAVVNHVRPLIQGARNREKK